MSSPAPAARATAAHVPSLHGPLTHREACYELRQVNARARAGRIDRAMLFAELDYVLSRYRPGARPDQRERTAPNA